MARTSDEKTQALLENLTVELFQTETSAARHCRREAKRFSEDTSPRKVMIEVANHAESVLRELPPLLERHGLPTSPGGAALGALFSAGRERVFDHFVEAERSYRGTLLGMRHGFDLVTLYRYVAHAASLGEIVAFCDDWLAVRGSLVTRASDELAWFARHSDQAMSFAKSMPGVEQLKRVLARS